MARKKVTVWLILSLDHTFREDAEWRGHIRHSYCKCHEIMPFQGNKKSTS